MDTQNRNRNMGFQNPFLVPRQPRCLQSRQLNPLHSNRTAAVDRLERSATLVTSGSASIGICLIWWLMS